jgi:hypothetical protein
VRCSKLKEPLLIALHDGHGHPAHGTSVSLDRRQLVGRQR